jgi:hypothetical protein
LKARVAPALDGAALLHTSADYRRWLAVARVLERGWGDGAQCHVHVDAVGERPRQPRTVANDLGL